MYINVRQNATYQTKTHISSRLTSPPQDLCLQGHAVPHQTQASLNHNETHHLG